MPSSLASPLDPAATTGLGPAPFAPPSSTPAPQQNLTNFNAANTAMKLTPQEQNLYQMHLKNLAAGGVANPAGGTSTLYQITVQFGDKTLVIPTVWNGKIVPPEQAIELVRQYGLDKFPAYDSEQAAQARYDQMHAYMEKDLTATGR
jgi:hypothetical protein